MPEVYSDCLALHQITLANETDSSITNDMGEILNRNIFNTCTFEEKKKVCTCLVGCCCSENSVRVFAEIGD
jgi:hypothetical protein